MKEEVWQSFLSVADTSAWHFNIPFPPRFALAWLLAKKPWIVPIPGTTKLNRLKENIVACEIQLSKDDLHEIEVGASKLKVHGARYPEEYQKMVDRSWQTLKSPKALMN